MLVTHDTEIEALPGRLTDEIRRSSNDSLVGLYVYGSLVTGDFDKGTDVLAAVGLADSAEHSLAERGPGRGNGR